MKELMEEIFQAEKGVGVILEEARKKASAIRLAGDAESTEKISEAKVQAQNIIEDAIKNAHQQADRTREEKLQEADSEQDSLLNEHSSAIENLTDDICRIILESNYGQE